MTAFPLSLEKALRTGWEAWKRQWWLLPAMLIFSGLISSTPQAMEKAGVLVVLSFPVAVLSLVVGVVVEVGIVYVALGLRDGKKMRFSEVFSQYPLALRYFAAYVLFLLMILSGVMAAAAIMAVLGYYTVSTERAIAVGLIGFAAAVFVYVGLRLQFYSYVLVDQKLGIAESLQKSWKLTRGHTLELFSLWIALLVVNILGLLAFILGVFISISVSMVAFADVYRQLSSMEEESLIQKTETEESARALS